jgi:hypothetical protein
MNYHDYKDCIGACLKCAAICNHCSSSSLQEKDVTMMARCIQIDIECAAICYAAAQLMSVGSSKSHEVCRLCVQLCRECSDECENHDNEHCRECAKACRNCAEECMEMLEVF